MDAPNGDFRWSSTDEVLGYNSAWGSFFGTDEPTDVSGAKPTVIISSLYSFKYGVAEETAPSDWKLSLICEKEIPRKKA